MKKGMLPHYINFAIILFSLIYFISLGNFEFSTYAIAYGLLVIFLAKTDKKFNYINIAKWGFTLWLVLHVSGGLIFINGIRLYDTIIWNLVGFPYEILKWDQFLHILIYFVLALLAYSAISPAIKKEVKYSKVLILAFLISVGLGSLFESLELWTVIIYPEGGVGTYINNTLDLVFNSVGALLAVIYLYLRKKIGTIKWRL